jgi:hypothetical protein
MSVKRHTTQTETSSGIVMAVKAGFIASAYSVILEEVIRCKNYSVKSAGRKIFRWMRAWSNFYVFQSSGESTMVWWEMDRLPLPFEGIFRVY